MTKLTNMEVRLRCVEALAATRFTDGYKLVNIATAMEQWVMAAPCEPAEVAEEKLDPDLVADDAKQPEAQEEAPKRRGRPPKADKA